MEAARPYSITRLHRRELWRQLAKLRRVDHLVDSAALSSEIPTDDPVSSKSWWMRGANELAAMPAINLLVEPFDSGFLQTDGLHFLRRRPQGFAVCRQCG
jgi:hypothetical protein